jgi:hypothetical protein
VGASWPAHLAGRAERAISVAASAQWHVRARVDFAQDAGRERTGSGNHVRRAILGRALLNRCRGGANLATKTRKPFDVLAEGLQLWKVRGDGTPVELFVDGIRAWEPGIRALITLKP